MNNLKEEYHKIFVDVSRMNITSNWLHHERTIIQKVIEELFACLGIEQYNIKNTYMIYFMYRNLPSLLRLNERDKTVTIHYVGDSHNKKKKRYSYVEQIQRRLDYLADQNISIEQAVLRDNSNLNNSSNIL